MKIRRYRVLIGLVLAIFGVFGLMGVSDAIYRLTIRNPPPSFSVVLGQLAPHLILLLCWPAAIALILGWRRKRKQQ